MHLYFIIALSLLLLNSCFDSGNVKGNNALEKTIDTSKAEEKILANQDEIKPPSLAGFEWIDPISTGITLDMPYATTNNIAKERLYPCAACFLRPEAARAFYKAIKIADSLGFQFLVFDCYRPLSVQQKLYDALPDQRFVAKPGKDAMHPRGCAIDLSLIQAGNSLDMGSAFDEMSARSYYNFSGLTAAQKTNREMLRSIMMDAGFKPYEKEWWHFSFTDCKGEAKDFIWECK